mgnify:CR=1 FL=1
MNIDIRKLEVKDRKKLSELYSQEWKTDISEDMLNEFLNTGNLLFVIEYKNKIIASANLHIQHKLIHGGCKMGYIEEVITSNKYRGLGMGKKIINRLLEEGKKMGCYKVALLCNIGLEKFYLNSGMITQKKIAMEHIFKENFTY